MERRESRVFRLGKAAAKPGRWETTVGQWSLFFDGSTIGPTLSGEDVFGAWVGAGDHLYLSTMAAFAVAGVFGGCVVN